MRKDTKLEKIRVAMQNEDWDAALQLAAKFHRLGEHKEAIQRAARASQSPALYVAMGYDLSRIREAGIIALKERYSKSWENVRTGRRKTSGGSE
jgi:hypothetical protein